MRSLTEWPCGHIVSHCCASICKKKLVCKFMFIIELVADLRATATEYYVCSHQH